MMGPVKEYFRKLLRYDLKANQAWLETLDGWNDPAANQVLDHIAQAQRTWMSRVDPEMLPAEEKTLDAELKAMHDAWLRLLDDWDLDMRIEYANQAGEVYSEPLWEILAHVINHGTYHRGHLRGMAGERPFPETDLIRFFRHPG